VAVLRSYVRGGCSQYRLGATAARAFAQGGAAQTHDRRHRDMTPRQRRLVLVLGILAGVSVAGALALSAFRQDVTFYFIPSQVAAGKVHPGEDFRLGGMVEKGSVSRQPGSMEVRFTVTDFTHQIPVVYDRVLPD